MDKPVVASLKQRLPLGRALEVVLTEDDVRIRSHTLLAEAHRVVPLEAIDRNESDARNHPNWTRAVAIVSACAALVSALWCVRFAGWLWPASAGPALWGAFGALGLAALAAFLHVALASESVIFYHAFTGDFLFAIRHDRPDRATVDAFLGQVKERAKRRAEQMQSDAERPSVAKELLALRDLNEKKIITDDEFSLKRSELLDEIMRD